jgi:hypothetical protein
VSRQELLLLQEAEEVALGARHLVVRFDPIGSSGRCFEDDVWVWEQWAKNVEGLCDGFRRRYVACPWGDGSVHLTVWGHRSDEVVLGLVELAHVLGATEVREALW